MEGLPTAPTTLNRFAYAQNDPVGKQDFSGRFFASITVSLGISGLRSMYASNMVRLLFNSVEIGQCNIAEAYQRRMNAINEVAAGVPGAALRYYWAGRNLGAAFRLIGTTALDTIQELIKGLGGAIVESIRKFDVHLRLAHCDRGFRACRNAAIAEKERAHRRKVIKDMKRRQGLWMAIYDALRDGPDGIRNADLCRQATILKNVGSALLEYIPEF